MTIEVNLGIIAANLAPLRILAIKLIPALRTQRSGGETYGLPTYNRNSTFSSPDTYHHYITSSKREGRPRRQSSVTGDSGEVPLRQVLQTKEVRLDYTERPTESQERFGDGRSQWPL